MYIFSQMAATHTVTCTDEQEKLIKQMHLSPSAAFQRGIMSLSNEEPAPDPNVSYDETPQAQIIKLQRANRVMQEHILEITEKFMPEKKEKGGIP